MTGEELLLDLRPERVEASLARSAGTHVLGDGRTLAYDEHGDPGGRPVFWLHGAPSCRLEAIAAGSWGERAGVRWIAPDRPGLGGSSLRRGGGALDVASDIAALADALGLARFAVFGGSGGGPYALACAAALAPRLDAVVCSAPGGVAAEAPAVAGWVDRLASALARHAPLLLHAYFRVMGLAAAVPSAVLSAAAVGVEAPLVRAAVRTGLGRALLRETFRQGTQGAVDDFRRLGDFGFRLGAIGTPVLFVQGTRDPFVPVEQTRAFARLTPGSRLVELEGAGHGGAIFALDRIAAELGWAPRPPGSAPGGA